RSAVPTPTDTPKDNGHGVRYGRLCHGDYHPMSSQQAWAKSLEEFEVGYGPPDFDDPIDRNVFLQILEREVAVAFQQTLAERFHEETERLRAQLGRSD